MVGYQVLSVEMDVVQACVHTQLSLYSSSSLKYFWYWQSKCLCQASLLSQLPETQAAGMQVFCTLTC